MRWIALNFLKSLIRWIVLSALYATEPVRFLALRRFRWSVAKQKENTTANHNKA